MASIKKERREALFRVVVLIVSGIIVVCLWSYIARVLMLVNWLVALITGKRNREIALFNEYWNTSLYQFVKYMSGVTNKRPFPFTPLKAMGKFEK